MGAYYQHEKKFKCSVAYLCFYLHLQKEKLHFPVLERRLGQENREKVFGEPEVCSKNMDKKEDRSVDTDQ